MPPTPRCSRDPSISPSLRETAVVERQGQAQFAAPSGISQTVIGVGRVYLRAVPRPNASSAAAFVEPSPGPATSHAPAARAVAAPSTAVPSPAVPSPAVPSPAAPSPAAPARHLFRAAAVDARRAEVGAPQLESRVTPRSWSVLGLLVSLVALSFIGAALASVEVTAEARGVLRAPMGLRPVASVLGGSVDEVLVHAGDTVESGQLLARLEATELRAGLLSRERELDRSRAEAVLSEKRERELDARAARALERRRAALQSRIDVSGERLRQRRERSVDYDVLVRQGGASRAEGLSVKEALQEASEAVSSSSSELALLELEQVDRARLAQERESARRTLVSRAEADVEEARARLASAEVRAPASGRVESLSIAAGAVIEAGAVLGNIVPSGAPRSIVAFVASQEVAFVVVGAQATVDVGALPVSEFGRAEARVTRVSSDVATPAEVQAALGEAASAALVRVELELVESVTSAKMEGLLRSGDRVKLRLHRRDRRLAGLLFDFVGRWLR
jgi:multidrug resistance efflux pump